MSIITLDGIEYITEAIGDEAIPAHNYDEVIDVSKAEDPDQWFGRVQAEWPSLPSEIKTKVIDSTGQYIGKLSNEVQLQQDDQPADPNAPLEEARKDSAGNEIYDFAEGRAKIQKLSDSALVYTRNDLIEAIKANEDLNRNGYNAPKLGYYWDEYWTVVDEIARRQKAGKQFDLPQWSLSDGPVDDKLAELGE